MRGLVCKKCRVAVWCASKPLIFVCRKCGTGGAKSGGMMTTTDKANRIINRKSMARFHSLETARRWCYRSAGQQIIMGDDDRFWVVSNRDASILVKAGYEAAR